MPYETVQFKRGPAACDGSAQDVSWPDVAAAGWAVIQQQCDNTAGELTFRGIYGPVPQGQRQNSQYAEHAAYVAGVHKGVTTEMGVDCKGVLETAGHHHSTRASYRKLHAGLWRSLANKQLPTTTKLTATY